MNPSTNFWRNLYKASVNTQQTQMKTKITKFAAVVILLGSLGFVTATQAQHGHDGNHKKNHDRSDQGKSFIALTNNNVLVKGHSHRKIAWAKVTGTNENLLAIDYRPANGMLYGITSTKVYTIDENTGSAKEVSTLSFNNQPITLNIGLESGVDFNPVVDRLRVVGSNDQNFRINVDTGAVLVDSNLNYAVGDRNAGKNPSITAVAYTNSFAGGPDPTRTTVLYGIDYDRNVLTIQNPPNAGTLQTVGSLRVKFDRLAGFNISEENQALAVSNSTIYEIDLSGGRVMKLASLPKAQYIGLAVPIGPK